MGFAVRFLSIAAMLAAGALAQTTSGTTTTGGTTTGGASSGTTTGTTSTGSSTATATGTPSTNPAPSTPRLIYLSGSVMMGDGSPLPGSVAILSVCGAVQRTVAHTTPKGDFGFTWGDTASVFADASQTGRIATGSSSTRNGSATSSSSAGVRGIFQDHLGSCELRADLPGYRSSQIDLYNHAALDNPDVGVIIVQRLTADDGLQVSMSSLRAPKDAKKSFDKGMELERGNKLGDAAAQYEKAVGAYPEYADAWLGLGRTQSLMDMRDIARATLRRAMELDGKLVGPWQELGYIASDEKKWAEAARYLDKAVKLDPTGSPMAWYFDGLANYNLGRIEKAEECVLMEMRLDTAHRHASADYLLGMVFIAKQDLEHGAELLRKYIRAAPFADEVETAKLQLSKVESRLGQ